MPPKTANLADDKLVRQARKGRLECFNALVVQHQDRLFNAVYRMVGNQEDAADIVQETFLRAFRGLQSFRGDSSFYTWIFSIAFNTVISQRRKRSIRTVSASDPPADAEPGSYGSAPYPPDHSGEPSGAVERQETHRRIQAAIQSLDPDSRSFVILRDIEGLSYSQIAEVLGVHVGTVKSRLHRARLQLREMLDDLVTP